jgi:ribulose-phosphate 3-epimerase
LSSQILNFKEKINKKNKKGTFLMSPIEIEYGDFFKKVAGLFIKKKLNIFHLDVGDGEFISRKLDVTQKLKYIKKLNRKYEVHLHLMVNNPHTNDFDNNDYITHYANLGADYIGVHRRTFENISEMEKAIIKIISLKRKPGIFIEIDEDFDYELSSLVLKYNIQWLVFMGVPIGYGGQFFNKTIIPKIKQTLNFLKKKNHKVKIEVDGGLTTEVIDQLNTVGVDYFAGWSIVKGRNLSEISLKLDNLKKYLN